jgi:hypothetical protein
MVKAEVGESEGRERVKTALQGLVMPTATAWVSIPCVFVAVVGQHTQWGPSVLGHPPLGVVDGR